MAGSKKALGFFQLVMINVIAIDSIRTLPFAAVYGFSLVFFYLLATLIFFLPTAMVSAELATGWPNRGGIYIWVREAFGKRIAFFIIWLNWIYNVFWYPTILALITGTFAYLFNPELAKNPLYMALGVLLLFWFATWVNCKGMRASSALSTTGALLGTLFPIALISLLGIIWVFKGNPIQITINSESFFPKSTDMDNLAFLTAIFFGLIGLEMSATHAQEMRNPVIDYPRSVFTSVWIILATIILGSLAIAIMIPSRELSLAVGIMQAFTEFLRELGFDWAIPVIAGCIVLGGLSGVSAWIIGPTKGLLVASEDGSLPALFSKVNKDGVPSGILITQGIIVSFLSLLYVIFPTVNQSFWIFSVITAQLGMIVYIGLFSAALKLSYSKPDIKRHYRIPGGKIGIWTVCMVGSLSCFLVICLGFVPTSQIPVHNLFLYEGLLIFGMLAACLPPFWIYRKVSKR